MKFILVRHGEVDPAAGADPPLSERGLAQARAAAEELRAQAGRGLTHASVLRADRRAAQDAAEHIVAALQLAGADQRRDLTAVGEENGADAAAERAWAALEELKQTQPPDASIILVLEELTVRVLLCRALGMPLADMRRFALLPGSISVIEYRTQPRERTLIASLNETCHLEGLTSKQEA